MNESQRKIMMLFCFVVGVFFLGMALYVIYEDSLQECLKHSPLYVGIFSIGAGLFLFFGGKQSDRYDELHAATAKSASSFIKRAVKLLSWVLVLAAFAFGATTSRHWISKLHEPSREELINRYIAKINEIYDQGQWSKKAINRLTTDGRILTIYELVETTLQGEVITMNIRLNTTYDEYNSLTERFLTSVSVALCRNESSRDLLERGVNFRFIVRTIDNVIVTDEPTTLEKCITEGIEVSKPQSQHN